MTSSRHLYVIGRLRSDASSLHSSSSPVVQVLTHSRRRPAWSSRSTCASRLQHDYPRTAGLRELEIDWLHADLEPGFMMTSRREEALEHLATHWQSWVSSREWFLKGDPSLSEHEAAERVLRHLESGW